MESRELEQLRQELIALRKEQRQLLERLEKIENKIDVSTDPAPAKKWIDSQIDVNQIVDKEKKTGSLKGKENALVGALKEKSKKTEVNSAAAGDEKEKKDLEFRIGGTWLNRIGIIAVILGLAYFLKYSFDNQWIGPTGRVLLGILAGLIMMGVGEKLRHRYAGYAQGLLGGGSLALFFSIYSSYGFYQLISPVFAFLLLTLVMINTVFMAVRHHSLPIGILGIIGGYTIPFMIGSDEPSLWTLNSYLTLLTAGVLAVSIYKKWSSFQYLSFIFNQLIFAFIWIEMFWFGTTRFVWSQFVFLIILFVFYLGVASIYNIRKRNKATRWDIGLIVVNAFSFFMWSIELLEATFLANYLGFYAVFLALVYIYLGKMAYRLFGEDKAQVYSLFVVSFMLLTVAIPLQFSGMLIGLAWLAEAVGFTFMAKKLEKKEVAYSGLLLLALGLYITYEQIAELRYHDVFLLNVPTLLLFSSLLAVIVMARMIGKMKEQKIFEFNIVSLLKGAALFLIFVVLTVENHHFFLLRDTDFFLSPEQLTLSTLWLLYAIVLFVFGIRKSIRYLRYAALGLVAVVIVKAFFIDLANLATMFKILLFIFLGLCLLGISYLYQKKKDSFEKKEDDV